MLILRLWLKQTLYVECHETTSDGNWCYINVHEIELGTLILTPVAGIGSIICGHHISWLLDLTFVSLPLVDYRNNCLFQSRYV